MEKPHKKLNAWKLSIDLVTQVYKITKTFPKEEQYCLTSQIRRAAISIPSNIAEGAARQTRKKFSNYLHMAQGSLSELDTQLQIARNLDYLRSIEWEILEAQMYQIDKMISGLIRSNIVKRQRP
ncbi:MAG: four helix bundle protein [Candidatus Manganitrophaceae bacterium]|nr:MAG: four helix bundle protein [Candidatus Manganitrophaceae bacterium]